MDGALSAGATGALVFVVALGSFALVRSATRSDGPVPADDERTAGWVTVGSLDDLRARWAAADGVAYVKDLQVFLVQRQPIVEQTAEPLALSALSTHLGEQGERVLFCPSTGWFEEQFHASKWDRLGSYALGPAPRGLDRVALRVVDGQVQVDPDRVTPGPARGAAKPLPPEGPFCAGSDRLPGPIEGRPGFALTPDEIASVDRAGIVVAQPKPGDHISTPVTIRGDADVFNDEVHIRILDASGNVLADTFTTATCGTGCRGVFQDTVGFRVDEEQAGTIQVFEMAARPRYLVQVPVTLLTPPAVGDVAGTP